MCHYLPSNVSISLSLSCTIFLFYSLNHPALSLTCTMGWLRSVRSIKLQVSFAGYRLFYRALLQKRPMILSIQLTKSTPYLSLLLSESSCTFTTAQICRKHQTSALYLFCIINMINLVESLFGNFSIVLCTHSHLKKFRFSLSMIFFLSLSLRFSFCLSHPLSVSLFLFSLTLPVSFPPASLSLSLSLSLSVSLLSSFFLFLSLPSFPLSLSLLFLPLPLLSLSLSLSLSRSLSLALSRSLSFSVSLSLSLACSMTLARSLLEHYHRAQTC